MVAWRRDLWSERAREGLCGGGEAQLMEPGLLTVAAAGAPGTPRERGETQARCEVHITVERITGNGPWVS